MHTCWLVDSEAGVYGFRYGSTGSFTRSRSHSKEHLLDDGKGKEAFNDLVYVGKKIPSKTFLALQKKIDEEPKNSPKGMCKYVGENCIMSIFPKSFLMI